MLIVVVSGSRDYKNYPQFKAGIDKVLVEWQYKLALAKSEIVLYNGDAQGTDKMVQQYSKEMGISVENFPANWKDFSEPCLRKFKGDYEYNALAGLNRNKKMIETALKKSNDVIFIAFWKNQSSGTKNAIEIADKAKIKNYIYDVS